MNMEIIWKIVGFMMSMAFVHSANDSYLDDYDWPADYDYDEYEATLPPPFTPAANNLEMQKLLVSKLYGSNASAKAYFWKKLRNSDQVYSNVVCGLDKIWHIGDLKSYIVSNGSSLSDEDKKILTIAADNDISEAVANAEEYFTNDCIDIFKELKDARRHLDCAMGEAAVTKALKNLLQQNKTPCSTFAQTIWTELLKVGDFDEKCNATLVYSEIPRLIKIAHNTNNRTDHRQRSVEIYAETLGARLVASISSPTHIQYLTRAYCPGGKSPWECEVVRDATIGVICNSFSLRAILEVEKLIKDSGNVPFESFDDAEIAMKILEDVTETVHKMSANSRTRIMSRNAFMSTSTLETYMDIMDRVIGTSSKKMWSNLQKNESSSQLCKILGNTEKYVWGMSRIFFNSLLHEDAPTDLERESMKLQMRRHNPKKSTGDVAFQFDDANIKTKLGSDEMKNELNVYAIHYRSLAELLQNKGLEVNGSSSNSTREFVGKGGIISLSAHQDKDKVSLPVSYRMNFQKSDVAQQGSRTFCLSCEYLDLDTQEWKDTGCSVTAVDDGGVTCDCNHTTNFAAFMSPVDVQYEMTNAQYQAKQITSYVGSALSFLALALCLIIFNVVKPSLRNERVKAHISLTFALLIVHMTQLASGFVINNSTACLISAVVTHYFLLAAFFWMLIEGIFLYLYVVQVFVHSSIEYLRLIYVLGWTVPGLIVLISASIGIPTDTYLDKTACGESRAPYPPSPDMGHKYKACWLSKTSGMAYSFIVPALLIIIVNSVILAKVFQVLLRVTRKNRNTNRPFSPSTSSAFSGHSNKAFGKKDQKGRIDSKSDVVLSSHKSTSDTESSYGSTTPINGKAASTDHHSKDRRSSPRHYMHNPTYSRQSPLHDGSETTNMKFIGEVRTALKGALVLLPILGIPWVCGLLASNSYVMAMIFVVLNSTQGILIFVVYCLMNGEVMRALRRQVKVAKLRSTSGRSRVGSASSLRSLNSKFTISWRTKSSTVEK